MYACVYAFTDIEIRNCRNYLNSIQVLFTKFYILYCMCILFLPVFLSCLFFFLHNSHSFSQLYAVQILFYFALFWVTASRQTFYLNISGCNRWSYVSNYENAKLLKRKWKLFIIFSASFKQWKQFQTLQLILRKTQVHDAEPHSRTTAKHIFTLFLAWFIVPKYFYTSSEQEKKERTKGE